MNELTRLIRNDCKPSLGVTEPGAIALAVAAAKERTRGTVRGIHLALNSGMYKNAFTCGIPGTREVGFLWAAALGAVAGKAEKELEALENIDEASVSAAKALLDAGAVTAEMTGIDSEIYIRADVKTEMDVCSVTIRHTHTNIVSIVLNGEELLEPVHETRAEEAAAPEIHGFSFEALVSYAKTVPIEEISFLREAFSMNLALLEEGLRDARTVVAHHLFEKNGKTLLSSDTWSTAQLLCAGAIEARVLGAGAPAMSITGSGSHGIIAVMPLYAAAKAEGYAEEALLRAAALSMLVTHDALSDARLTQWMNQTLRPMKKRMDANTCAHLAFTSGRDLTMLNGELQKLAAYVGERETITAEDVEQIATHTAECTVFAMVDALVDGQAERAFSLLNVLLEGGEQRIGVLALITRQYRQMLYAKDMQGSRTPQAQMAKALGVPPFALSQLTRRAGRRTMAQLKKQLALCVNADFDIKRGAVREEAALDRLMLALTEK